MAFETKAASKTVITILTITTQTATWILVTYLTKLYNR